MDPHLIPGEAAALREQEMAEALSDLANDEFEAGELQEQFLEEFAEHEEDFVQEALVPEKWPELTARIQPAAPKLFERIRAKVVQDRIETLKER